MASYSDNPYPISEFTLEASGSVGSGSIVPASAGNKPFWFCFGHTIQNPASALDLGQCTTQNYLLLSTLFWIWCFFSCSNFDCWLEHRIPKVSLLVGRGDHWIPWKLSWRKTLGRLNPFPSKKGKNKKMYFQVSRLAFCSYVDVFGALPTTFLILGRTFPLYSQEEDLPLLATFPWLPFFLSLRIRTLPWIYNRIYDIRIYLRLDVYAPRDIAFLPKLSAKLAHFLWVTTSRYLVNDPVSEAKVASIKKKPVYFIL